MNIKIDQMDKIDQIDRIDKIEKIENFDMFRLCKPKPNRRAWHLKSFLGIMDIMGTVVSLLSEADSKVS